MRCSRTVPCACLDKEQKARPDCTMCKGEGKYVCGGIIVGTPPLTRPFCNRCRRPAIIGANNLPRQKGVSHPSDMTFKVPADYKPPEPSYGLMPEAVAKAASTPAPSLPPQESAKPKSVKTIKSAADLSGVK